MKTGRGLVFIGAVAMLAAGACSAFSTASDNASPDAGSVTDAGMIADADANVDVDVEIPTPEDCDGAIFCEHFTATTLDPAKWKLDPNDGDAGTFTPGNGELIIDLPSGGDDSAHIQTMLSTSAPIRVSFDITINPVDIEAGTSVLVASVFVPGEFIGLFAHNVASGPAYNVALSTDGKDPIGSPSFEFGVPTHIELRTTWGNPGGMVTFFASPPDGGKEVQAGVPTSFNVSPGNPTLTIGPARTQGNTSALRIRYSNVLVRPLL